MSGRTGVIVGSSVVSLFEGIASQDRQDILDCISHAHQFASKHFDQRADYVNWLFRYRERLNSRGCVLKYPIMQEPKVVNSPSDLDSVAFNIITSGGSDLLVAQARECWRALRVRQYASQFLGSGVGNQELMRLQLVPCMQDDAGDIALLLCCIRLTGSEEVRDFDFWTQTRKEMLLRISGGVYRFERAVFGKYRDQIRSQLTRDADSAIKEFPI